MSEDHENILKQEKLGMIQVTRLEENEDGSATSRLRLPLKRLDFS